MLANSLAVTNSVSFRIFGFDTGTDILALLTAVLGTLAQCLVLAGCQTSQGLANLLGHLFLALFSCDDGLLGLVLLATFALALVLLVRLWLLLATATLVLLA